MPKYFRPKYQNAFDAPVYVMLYCDLMGLNINIV